jgi:Ca2+-binding RTX toxin-like protein
MEGRLHAVTRAALVVALLGLLVVPAAAQAHSSILRVRGGTLVYEQYRAKPEFAKNSLTVLDGTGNLRGYWQFSDPPTVGIVNNPPCVPLDGRDRRVVCPIDMFTELMILPKVGNDRVRVLTTRRVIVKGGPGNDTLLGGPGADKLYGDQGDDRLVAGRNGGALLDGGNGADVLDARNGKQDTIVACAADQGKRDAVDVLKSGCG